MSGFLLVLGFIVAVLWVFARVFRSRVQRRMEQVEMPPELMAAIRAKAATAAAARPAVAGAAAPVAAAVRPQLPHFMLIYDVGPDFLQRRAQHRDEHLALAWKASDAGELVLAGALEEPTEQALLLFRSRDAALRFAAADPYVKHGLVKGFKVKQWHTTVGAGAANPLRPKA